MIIEAGSATGSTFVRIFFKQLHFLPYTTLFTQEAGLDPASMTATAGLPPSTIAKLLWNAYIARIHTWWPFLSLYSLRQAMQQIYKDPSRCNEFQKFTVFLVFALGSRESLENEDYKQMRDLNSPIAYFKTGLRFFAQFGDHDRQIFNIQAVLLLGVWMLHSNSSSHISDLWQISRYAMSMALETGLHRHNKTWCFPQDELEIRNRTWWSVYALER